MLSLYRVSLSGSLGLVSIGTDNEQAPAEKQPWHKRGNCTLKQRSCRRTVLIADDDVEARASLSELLELAGHDVYVCGDGRDALRIACEHRPDVVILDIEMPGLDGYAVCRQLRSLHGFEETNIYAVSGLTGAAHERRCRQAGFTGQCVKPLEIGALDVMV